VCVCMCLRVGKVERKVVETRQLENDVCKGNF
jgi:hypothetical protein